VPDMAAAGAFLLAATCWCCSRARAPPHSSHLLRLCWLVQTGGQTDGVGLSRYIFLCSRMPSRVRFLDISRAGTAAVATCAFYHHILVTFSPAFLRRAARLPAAACACLRLLSRHYLLHCLRLRLSPSGSPPGMAAQQLSVRTFPAFGTPRLRTRRACDGFRERRVRIHFPACDGDVL